MSEITIKRTGTDNLSSGHIRITSIAQMEGIKETAELFKLPRHYIRSLALEGKIKAVRVSKSKNAKILINIQSLNDYLSNTAIDDISVPELNTGAIQPIPVKL